jgi:hypothetical protein
MKSWKNAVIGMVAIIALGFAFVGCDDKGDGENGEQPSMQAPSPITITLDKDYSVTVESSDLFTSSEWSQALLDIRAGIEAGYNTPGLMPWDTGTYRAALGNPAGATITIDKNPTYPNWKAVDGTVTELHLKFSSLKNLSSFITDAVTAMGSGNGGNG